MALVRGTNSNVTLSEADLYFEGRLDAAAWNDADEENKEQALITATSLLDDETWTGVAVSDSQSLAFPRVGTYFDPRLGSEVTFDSSEFPRRLKEATYELAYHLLNNDGLLDESGGVKHISVGSIELNFIRSPESVPGNVRRKIKPMLVNAGANAWWRSN